MNHTKIKFTHLLACGLTLIALPYALAGHGDKHSAEDMFKATDTNSDGKVSRTENAAHSAKMFTDTDTNRDGLVTVAEMTTAHDQMKADIPVQSDQPGRAGQTQAIDKDAMGEMTATEMVKMHDTNKDGQLSAAEQKAGCDSMFDKSDTNHDGSLSLAECQEGHKTMMKAKVVAVSSKQ